MIKVIQVSKKIKKRQILHDINFSIEKSCIWGILGENGAGKTTLLRILSGLVSPDAGEVLIDGGNIRYDNHKLRSQIGYMPEDGGLYKRLSVLDNLKFSLGFYDHLSNPGRQIDNYLSQFKLKDRQNERIGKLSGGMRRKVLFLKSVLHHPALLLLDEPFNGMDVESKQKAMDVIREIKNNRGAVCISSHSTGELENICDAYLFINQGIIRGKGSIQELESKLAISKHMSLASIYLKIMGG